MHKVPTALNEFFVCFLFFFLRERKRQKESTYVHIHTQERILNKLHVSSLGLHLTTLGLWLEPKSKVTHSTESPKHPQKHVFNRSYKILSPKTSDCHHINKNQQTREYEKCHNLWPKEITKYAKDIFYNGTLNLNKFKQAPYITQYYFHSFN